MTVTPIVALDVPDIAAALGIVRSLGESCGFYKVGSELFTATGPAAVEAVRREGKQVFLDLKFHDIPNTVRAAARSAARCGASLLTVHASGGISMVSAAVEGAGTECGVLAVTVLTALDEEALARTLGRAVASVSDEVSRLAGLAAEAGAHGVVCSGHEVARLRREQEGRLAFLVPGIRLAGGDVHDQRRVVTPRAAAEAGATYLVIGRPVTSATDRRAAMARVLSELDDLAPGYSGPGR